MSDETFHLREETLVELAYGELSSSEASAMQAHLAQCADCAGRMGAIKGLRKTMAQLPAFPAPEGGVESLIAYARQSAARRAAGPSVPPVGWRRLVWVIGGVAAVAVVGLVAQQVIPEVDVRSPPAREHPAPVEPRAKLEQRSEAPETKGAGPAAESAPSPAPVAPPVAETELGARAEAKRSEAQRSNAGANRAVKKEAAPEPQPAKPMETAPNVALESARHDQAELSQEAMGAAAPAAAPAPMRRKSQTPGRDNRGLGAGAGDSRLAAPPAADIEGYGGEGGTVDRPAASASAPGAIARTSADRSSAASRAFAEQAERARNAGDFAREIELLRLALDSGPDEQLRRSLLERWCGAERAQKLRDGPGCRAWSAVSEAEAAEPPPPPAQ